MKKVYKKPLVILENFSLSTSIAGDCEVKTDTQSRNTCGMDFSGITVFLDTMAGCSGDDDIPITSENGDGESDDGICYHVSSNGYNLFTS